MQQKQTDLIDTHLSLLNYSCEKHYSYDQWKNIDNAVMYKVIGNNKIHKIRILCQHEADYSLNIGGLWKELITVSKKRETINRGLHGGRKGHDAQTLSLIEELKYGISYSSRKTLINFDNDAVLCYNRILPNISSLITHKKGMSCVVTFVHVNMLEEAEYQLKLHWA